MPGDANAHRTRGEIYEKLGMRPQAIADYRATLKIDPRQQRAKAGLARLGVAS